MSKKSLKQRIQIERCPINWAQWIARKYHYLHREVHPRAHPFAYQVFFDGESIRPDGHPCGMVMFATVHFTRQKELFGYDTITLMNGRIVWSEQLDQSETSKFIAILNSWLASHPDYKAVIENGLDKWQVLVLSRMWLHDDLPRNSETCVMGKIWRRIQWDWLNHHPPVDNQKPYNIRLIISWSDLGEGHDGTIYKAANFTEIKRTKSRPRHGKGNTRGIDGFDLIQYAYWLKEPRLKLEQIKLL